MSSKEPMCAEEAPGKRKDEVFVLGELNYYALATKGLVALSLIVVSALYIRAQLLDKGSIDRLFMCNESDGLELCQFKIVAAGLSLCLALPFVRHGVRLFVVMFATNVAYDKEEFEVAGSDVYVMSHSGDSLFAIRQHLIPKSEPHERLVADFDVLTWNSAGPINDNSSIDAPEDRIAQGVTRPTVMKATWELASYFVATLFFPPLLLLLVGLCFLRACMKFKVEFLSDIAELFVFYGLLVEFMQSLSVLPLAWIVIMSSQTPGDVLVNFVALQYFTQVDEQVVQLLHNVRAAVEKDILNYLRPTTTLVDRNGFKLKIAPRSSTISPAVSFVGQDNV